MEAGSSQGGRTKGLGLARVLQKSWVRKLLAPVERLLRPVLLRHGQILFGDLRGYRFPGGGRGTLLGTYEEEVQGLLRRCLGPGDVFYDIGAHHGYFSLFGSELVREQGGVFSFEPAPANVSHLRGVVDLNGLTNVTLVPRAVSDSDGTADLFLGDGRNDYRPSLFPWKGDDHVAVETITLDRFIESNPAPAVIKIDVEGAEFHVLKGADRLLSGTAPPVVILEIHGAEVRALVEELLLDQDYRLHRLPGDARRPFPHHLLALPKSPRWLGEDPAAWSKSGS